MSSKRVKPKVVKPITKSCSFCTVELSSSEVDLCTFCKIQFFSRNINSENAENGKRVIEQLGKTVWYRIIGFLSGGEVLKEIRRVCVEWKHVCQVNSPIWHLFCRTEFGFSEEKLSELAKLHGLSDVSTSCYAFCEKDSKVESVEMNSVHSNDPTRFAISFSKPFTDSYCSSRLFLLYNDWFHLYQAICNSQRRKRLRYFAMKYYRESFRQIDINSLVRFTRWATILCYNEDEFKNSQVRNDENSANNNENTCTNSIDIPLGVSKLGGLPDLPPIQTEYDAINTIFIAQINLNEFSAGSHCDNPFDTKENQLGMLYLFAKVDPNAIYQSRHPSLNIYHIAAKHCKKLQRKSKFERGFLKQAIDLSSERLMKERYIEEFKFFKDIFENCLTGLPYNNSSSLSVNAGILLGTCRLHFADIPTFANNCLEDKLWQERRLQIDLYGKCFFDYIIPKHCNCIWAQMLGYFGHSNSSMPFHSFDNDWGQQNNYVGANHHHMYLQRNLIAYGLSRKKFPFSIFQMGAVERIMTRDKIFDSSCIFNEQNTEHYQTFFDC